MARYLGILAVVLSFSLSSRAAVTILCDAPTIRTMECGQQHMNVYFSVRYSYDGVGSFPRAFALDITASPGVISAVTPAVTGESSTGSKGFGIFPGTMTISSDGIVTDSGTPVAPQSDLPAGTHAGLGTQAVTVELASLYATTAAKPANSGKLCTVVVSNLPWFSTVTLTITPNVARGGIMLEDGTSTGSFSTGCNGVFLGTLCDCFASSLSTYNRWISSGKPSCWCPPASVIGMPYGGSGYQCVGDVDGTKFGSYRVYNGDVQAIAASWKKNIGAGGYNPCADVDHAVFGSYGVYNGDISRVSSMWKKTDPQLNAILGVGTTGGYCGMPTVPPAYK
jgi:hypothetical protein